MSGAIKPLAYNTRNAAAALDVKEATIVDWFHRGILHGVQAEPGGRILIPVAEIERFLAQGGAAADVMPTRLKAAPAGFTLNRLGLRRVR